MNYLRVLDNEILHNLHFDAICDMDTHVYHSNIYLLSLWLGLIIYKDGEGG